jgi:hypothetical protein
MQVSALLADIAFQVEHRVKPVDLVAICMRGARGA